MNILLVQTGFLGDVILSSAVFRNIKTLYPNSKLSVVTTPQALDLVKFNQDVDEAIPFAKRDTDSGLIGLWQFARKLRAGNFDIVFSLHKSARTSVLLALSGIKTKYGFKESTFSFLYDSVVARSDLKHDVLRNLAILRNINKEPEELEQSLSLGLSADWCKKAEDLLRTFSSKPLIGLAPGSVWETKKWRIEGFADLAEMLTNKGYFVVLLGGPSDRDVSEQIQQRCSSNILNLVGQTSLGESAAIVSKLKLLVTNDSAPQHMASALGTPQVAVFCATVPEFGYGPWQVPHEVVGVEGLSCRPCAPHGGNTCPIKTFACREQLTAQMVLAASERVLAGTMT